MGKCFLLILVQFKLHSGAMLTNSPESPLQRLKVRVTKVSVTSKNVETTDIRFLNIAI